MKLVIFIIIIFLFKTTAVDAAPVCQPQLILNPKTTTLIDLNVYCENSVEITAYVLNGLTGQILCYQDRYIIADTKTRICTIQRNPFQRLVYVVNLIDKTKDLPIAYLEGTLNKDPSFIYPARGIVLTESKMNLVPKIIKSRKIWEFTFRAQVFDRDVDPYENLKPILVELIAINEGGKKILETQHANTADIVEFQIQHHTVIDKEPVESQEGMIKGLNTLILRIHDGYGGKTYVDLEPVSVQLLN